MSEGACGPRVGGILRVGATLKRDTAKADVLCMGPRKATLVTLLLAAAVLPGLSGCASVDGSTPVSAAVAGQRQTGVLEEFVEQLKKEDDEAETEELKALREMRQEQQEEARQRELEPS